MTNTLRPLRLAVTAALATLWLAPMAVAQEPTAQVGQPAPDFTLTDETGQTHTLSQYRGNIVVLEWTSSECPFVIRQYESRRMQETAEALAGQNDTVVWLSIDSTHFNTRDTTLQWKARMGFDYPTLLDADGTVGHLYGARTTPHMYVIDAEGVLRYQGAIHDDPRGTNENPTNYVSQAVTALLAGEGPPVTSSDPWGCTVKYADAD